MKKEKGKTYSSYKEFLEHYFPEQFKEVHIQEFDPKALGSRLADDSIKRVCAIVGEKNKTG